MANGKKPGFAGSGKNPVSLGGDKQQSQGDFFTKVKQRSHEAGQHTVKSGVSLKDMPNDPSVPKPPEEPIEDQVLKLPGMRSIVEVPLFRKFLELVLPRVRLGSVSHLVMEAFASPDVNAERVGKILRGNQYYELQFLKLIESIGKRKELPGIESAVVLLGMQKARDYLLALQLIRSLHEVHPRWNKDGKLEVVPENVLVYGTKVDDIMAKVKDGSAPIAFAGGVLFDVMRQLCLALSDEPKKTESFIEQLFLHSLHTAKVGTEISRYLHEFSFRKYVFGACLVHDIGKAVMAILDPSYIKFIEMARDQNLPRSVRQFAETKRFGVGHATISALVCRVFEIFQPVERGVLFHHESYLLRNDKRDHFNLASLIALATNASSNFKKVETIEDPVLNIWKGLELRDFKLNSRLLIEISQSVAGS